jgi:hypothetical protein
VIDHLNEKTRFGDLPFQRCPGLCTGTKEHRLAGVGVSNPLVENQRAQEVSRVLDFSKELVRQKVEDRDPVRMNRHLGRKVQPGQHGVAPGANRKIKVRAFRNEVFGQLDNGAVGNVDLKVPEKGSRKPFIDKDPPMLGIVDEFNDVKSAIVRLDEMGLGASPHFSDQALSLK